MALAAYLHDLGKFAERARIPLGKENLEFAKQQYCPRKTHGQGANNYHYTHIHAAYTALAFDLVEKDLPALRATDLSPFGGSLSPDVADSLVNAAARHHTPDTFLQWIIATADRVASGFERDAFERYNHSDDLTDTGLNHYQARQLSLLEGIRLAGRHPTSSAEFITRQPLRPLSPEGLFPALRQDCEGNDNGRAQQEYALLWEQFMRAIGDIPASHRHNLPIWLDHFDSAWQTFTHAIPSATVKGTRPDVSLYDHSHTAAALATALWRYHHDRQDDLELARTGMASRGDWDDKKFLLIQGDFFGVQSFIFSSGSDTRKRAAKLLRGRSLYVSLITECAALRVLEALDLPGTSQVTNAAGKFLIVAPNTPETCEALIRVQQEFDEWFLSHSYGQSGLGLAWVPASCNQFVQREGQSGFRALMKTLFAALDRNKYRAFDLCGAKQPAPVFVDYLSKVSEAGDICAITGWGPGSVHQDGMKLSPLAADQVRLGDLIAAGKRERLAITREPLAGESSKLHLPLFGYHLYLTGGEEVAGKFGPQAKSGNLRRLFDFSLPEDANSPLWNGYSRRAINGYVPVFTHEDSYALSRYTRRDEQSEPTVGAIKEFGHIACENRRPGSSDTHWIGVEGLGILKGDVDDLGAIFQKGLESPTFAKMAALSRQMNAFFSTYLPWLCKSHYPNTYTVFAGGDDFFLIGPWHSLMQLAATLRKEFTRYVGGNPELHFSAGLVVTKPGMPVPQLSRLAEEALEAAKGRSETGAVVKDGIHSFDHTLSWPVFDQLAQACETLEKLRGDAKLSTGFVYGLLKLSEMAEDRENPASALWRSQLNYRTWRHLERTFAKEQRSSLHQKLMKAIGHDGIQAHGGAYRVALTTHLYLNRD